MNVIPGPQTTNTGPLMAKVKDEPGHSTVLALGFEGNTSTPTVLVLNRSGIPRWLSYRTYEHLCWAEGSCP